MKFTLQAVFFLALAMPVTAFCADMSASNEICDAGNASNMKILEQNLKIDKKQVVSNNIVLEADESNKFWPIYDDYQKELESINLRIANAINSYAATFKDGAAPNSAARILVDEMIEIEFDEISLKKKYAAKLRKIIPDNKVARYIQIENKVRTILRYQLSDSIPLL